MNNQFFKGSNASENTKIQVALCDKTVATEISEEFSLPDYQPEIKRLIRISANLEPCAKYVGSESAEFSGRIDYFVLYMGNDAKLYCAPLSSDYGFSVALEYGPDVSVGDRLLCYADNTPSLIAGRVISPRRISIKCRLSSRVRVFGYKSIDAEMLGGVPQGSLERLMGEKDSLCLAHGVSDPIVLDEEIFCEDTSCRVICAEGHVTVSETLAASGAVNCKGELCVKIMAVSSEENEAPYVITKKIPFSENVEVDMASVNCECSARGYCTELSISVEDSGILCSAAIVLEAFAQRNDAVSYVKDVYSTQKNCKSEIRPVSFQKALKAACRSFTHSASFELPKMNIERGAQIIDACARAYVSSVEPNEKGRLCITGKNKYQIISMSNGEFFGHEAEHPFKYEIDGVSGVPASFDVSCDALVSRIRHDGENLGIDSEMCFAIRLLGESEVSCLWRAEFSDARVKKSSEYCACFPSHKDTLWSVGKRYGVSISELSAKNTLPGAPSADSAESLDGVKYIIV